MGCIFTRELDSHAPFPGFKGGSRRARILYFSNVRQTEDIDLGVNADLRSLQALAASLTSAGYSVELREPDTQDSLGGALICVATLAFCK